MNELANKKDLNESVLFHKLHSMLILFVATSFKSTDIFRNLGCISLAVTAMLKRVEYPW